MATPEMIAAVTAAVNGDPLPADPAPVADPPAAADAAPQDLLGDDPAAPAADPAAAATLDASETDPPADGPVRGPDGKFVAKDKAAEPAAPAEPKAADPPAAAAQPKAPDHINDPIPEGVKEATRERITSLVDTVKTERAEKEAVYGDLELLAAPIREANATPEQFRESMQLVRLINSPHQHEQMQALQMLQGAASQLAQRLGQPVPGADPLEGFNDLINEVNTGKLTEQRAAEIANGRRQAAAQQRWAQQVQQRSHQDQAAQQTAKARRDAVRAVEQTLQATDPSYAAKVAIMSKDAAFVAQLQAMPPAQAVAAFSEKYRSIQVAAPAAPAARPAAPASPSPLRAKTPAGTAARPPATTLDAVKAGLAAAGGG